MSLKGQVWITMIVGDIWVLLMGVSSFIRFGLFFFIFYD